MKKPFPLTLFILVIVLAAALVLERGFSSPEGNQKQASTIQTLPLEGSGITVTSGTLSDFKKGL